MNTKISARDKKIVIILIISVLGFLLYQYGYLKYTDKMNLAKQQYEALDKQDQDNQIKINKIPALNQEIETVKSSIKTYAGKFYGQIPQENILYFIQNMSEKTKLKLVGITFNEFPSETFGAMLNDLAPASENSQAAPIAEDTGEETTTPQPPPQEELPVIAPMQINFISAIVEFAGTYDQLKMLFNLVDNNKEKIVIDSVILQRAKQGYLNFPGYEIQGGQSSDFNLFDNSPSYQDEAKSNFKGVAAETPDDIQATIGFTFCLVPTINNYVEQENINKWELKSSTNNLFTWLDFLNTPLQKTNIYNFDADTYTISSEGAQNVGQIEKIQENNVYAALRYTFDVASKNPKIGIDLTDKNIEIKEPIKSIGLNIYSDNINKSKLYIVVEDANNKVQTILLTESLYWDGFANIDKSVPENMAYPLKVKRIVLSQEGEGIALKNGLLKFGFIYVKK